MELIFDEINDDIILLDEKSNRYSVPIHSFKVLSNLFKINPDFAIRTLKYAEMSIIDV